MKICVINGSRWIEGFHDAWWAMLRENFRRVLRPDTVVEMRSPERGLQGDRIADFSNEYFALLNRSAMIEQIIAAEREGFDAAVVAVGDDSGVREARSAVRIPVIGPGEAAMHLACQLGRRFAAIVANMPDTGLIGLIEDRIREYGLQDRTIPNGVRFDVHDFSETWEKGFSNPGFVAEGVRRGAEQLVRDGADVIVVLCCGIGPFCTAAGMSPIRIGSRAIPVLDAMTVGVKTAEMVADLGKGLGFSFTSAAIPSEEDLQRVRRGCGVEGPGRA